MFCANPACPAVVEAGSAGEYRNDVTHCPRCGARLIDDSALKVSTAWEQDDNPDFVVVARLDNAPSLVVARSMLEEAGIRHFVRNQQSFSPWGGPGGLGVLGQADLAVEPGRAAEAEQLLSEMPDAVPDVHSVSHHEDAPGPSSAPGLGSVVFFGVASALFLTAAIIDMLQSERVNGFWLFLGVMMGVFALSTLKRRRRAERDRFDGP